MYINPFTTIISCTNHAIVAAHDVLIQLITPHTFTLSIFLIGLTLIYT